MHALLERGVSTRRGIMNAHQEGAYAQGGSSGLPHSEEARDSVILLPLFNDMTTEQQSQVIQLLEAFAGTRAGVLVGA
jgi:dTDP-4-amino-4,6-dideoxygalactose transaminase